MNAEERKAEMKKLIEQSENYFINIVSETEEAQPKVDVFAPSASDIRNLFVRGDIARNGKQP